MSEEMKSGEQDVSKVSSTMPGASQPEVRPEGQQGEEEGRIPLSRLNREIQKRREAEDRALANERRMSELEQRLVEMQSESKFHQFAAGEGLPENLDELSERERFAAYFKQLMGQEAPSGGAATEVARLQEELAQMRLEQKLGRPLSDAQHEVLSDIRRKHGLNDPAELMHIARVREPELFQSTAEEVVSPAHHVQGPRSGAMGRAESTVDFDSLARSIEEAPNASEMQHRQVQFLKNALMEHQKHNGDLYQ